MRELSLFTGAGGGLLGTLLLGWRPVGYVEWNKYCQRVIAQRIADGILPAAPIFGDVRAFVSEGYAAAYQGLVDVLSGGFPCQPFSQAGKRLGADDPRNMWPATIAAIRAVRPRFAFLENVPGLVTSGYFGTILGDLAESGYDARWRILSAAEMGAAHKRDRLWIVAHTHGTRRDRPDTFQPDSHLGGNGAPQKQGGHTEPGISEPSREMVNTQRARDRRWQQLTGGSEETRDICRPFWWEVEPELGRLADGIPNRLDRIRAAGNAQVPAVAATAWRLLTEGLES